MDPTDTLIDEHEEGVPTEEERQQMVLTECYSVLEEHGITDVTIEFPNAVRNSCFYQHLKRRIALCKNWLYVNDVETFMEEAALHEVAHAITDHVHGYGTKTHGKEFKSIAQLIGAAPGCRFKGNLPTKYGGVRYCSD